MPREVIARAAGPRRRYAARLGGALATAAIILLISASPAGALDLYDQYDNPGGPSDAISSQDFEASFDSFDAQAADDFAVPSGSIWNVTGIDVDGHYSHGGPAASFNVSFYDNSGGLPGSPIATRPGSSFTESGGDFSITFDHPVSLSHGTYWVSVQAREDLASGQWVWQNRTLQSQAPSAWQNPGDGFATGCTSWSVKTSCSAGAGPDQVFRLNGTTAPPVSYGTQVSTGSIVAGTIDVGNHCDDCTTPIGFPFPVQFYGQTFTTALVSSNGNLQFSGSHANADSGCPMPSAIFDGAVLAYQGDLRTDAPGDGVFTKVTGSAPNRTFNVEWRAHLVSGGGAANFELRFHEDSPVITATYGATADSGASEGSGVQFSSTGPATQFSCRTTVLADGLGVDYVPNPRTLTVSKSGSGSGVVRSDPAGIKCGSACSRLFPKGTSVTLTATPAPGSVFAHWGGSCSGSGACSVTMKKDRSVTARFKAAP